MTKKLTLLLIVMMLAITSSAQIQRNFFGCTLGESTEAQVKKAMQARGIKLEWNKGGLIGYDVNFAGVHFDGIQFNFKRHKLVTVAFSILNASQFINLSKALREKYGSYEREDSEENYLKFNDEKTAVFLDNRSFDDVIGLIYMDIKLNLSSSINSSEL